MGAYNSQSACARGHVLVLFPERTRYPYLVEGMDHTPPDRPIHNRPRLVSRWTLAFLKTDIVLIRLRLLRYLHLLHLNILSMDAQCR